MHTMPIRDAHKRTLHVMVRDGFPWQLSCRYGIVPRMQLHQHVAALAVGLVSTFLSAQGKPQTAEPVVWGALTGNTSCVIFAEGKKTSGHFYGVAVTTKSVGKLTLVETQNSRYDQKEVLETQENLDNLMQMAQQDHVKFVKIPEKYSPELLERARTACKADARTQ